MKYLGNVTLAFFTQYLVVVVCLILVMNISVICFIHNSNNLLVFRDNSDFSSVCINLVREIRDRSIFVSGFDLSKLNQTIRAL